MLPDSVILLVNALPNQSDIGLFAAKFQQKFSKRDSQLVSDLVQLSLGKSLTLTGRSAIFRVRKGCRLEVTRRSSRDSTSGLYFL